MMQRVFAVIDPMATGRNILCLRKERGLSVKDIQRYFNFDEPRAIYKWQTGQSLPSLDNLYALSALFEVPMDRIIVGKKTDMDADGPQESSCGPGFWARKHAVRRFPGTAAPSSRYCWDNQPGTTAPSDPPQRRPFSASRRMIESSRAKYRSYSGSDLSGGIFVAPRL